MKDKNLQIFYIEKIKQKGVLSRKQIIYLYPLTAGRGKTIIHTFLNPISYLPAWKNTGKEHSIFSY